MKRLMFVAANPWVAWGGSEKLWTYAAKHMLDAGAARIAVLIRKWESLDRSLQEVLNASEVYFYQYKSSLLRRVLTRIRYQLHPPSVGEQIFGSAITRFCPDLIVISQGANYDGLEWMEWSTRHGVPYVTISQAATEEVWHNENAAERLAQAYLGAKHNFFVSRDNLRLTEVQVGARLPNSTVIFNPFDVPYEVELGFPPTEPDFRLACVARFELHAKAQDVLLETLSDPKWKCRNISAGLYGSGRDQGHVAKLIGFFGVQKTVKMMGFLEPREIWKENHALVLPSRYEGLPLALVEAMLCGRFGIVTNVSGNPEVIEEGVNGFIANAPKAEYLDDALERAWVRRNEWQTIGQKAKISIQGKVPRDPVSHFAEKVLNFV